VTFLSWKHPFQKLRSHSIIRRLFAVIDRGMKRPFSEFPAHMGHIGTFSVVSDFCGKSIRPSKVVQWTFSNQPQAMSGKTSVYACASTSLFPGKSPPVYYSGLPGNLLIYNSRGMSARDSCSERRVHTWPSGALHGSIHTTTSNGHGKTDWRVLESSSLVKSIRVCPPPSLESAIAIFFEGLKGECQRYSVLNFLFLVSGFS
jgi:hypothetical protein